MHLATEGRDVPLWIPEGKNHRRVQPSVLPPLDRRSMYPECLSDYMIKGCDKTMDHGYNTAGPPDQVACWDTGCRIPEDIQQTDAGEDEETSVVQTLPTNNAWYTFLKALRDKLEGMSCAEKVQASGDLLRYVHWHATNTAMGYLLGHMGGMVGELTALLVVALNDGNYLEGMEVTTATAGIWAEAERFLPQHTGSLRAMGRRIERHLPCIMIIHKPVPTSTPGSSNDDITDCFGHPPKRRHIEVTLQTQGPGDQAGILRLPLEGNSTSFGVNVRVVEEPACCSVQPETRQGSTNQELPLPEAGPGRLAELGVSMRDYKRMRYQWINDLITFQEIEATHGKEVVRLLQERWFGDEGLLLYAQEEPGEGQDRAAAGPSEPEGRTHSEAEMNAVVCNPTEETEENSHLALTFVFQAVVTQATWQGRAREYEALEIRLARDQLGRLRREGWTLREQASALYVLVQARNDGDYSDHFPTMMMELDLPVDVNLSPTCLPAACPVLTWIEAEMWDRFVDWFEGMIGAETESLQRIRNQPNMASETRAEWRDWAQSATSSRSTPPRSRSPRRPNSRAQREDQGDGEGGGDATSFMHTGNRGSSWDNTRRRARRRSTTGPRERSRDRRWERPTASAREERVRQ